MIVDADTKLRRRAVGTVRFIGELYKIDMLTGKIMRSCMNLLLDVDVISEETLECLCKLLTTVGEKMELKDAHKEDLGDYFKRLHEIQHKKSLKTSSRIRFMIQDVIDLRRNRWQPRRQDFVQKTIQQIQREADNEQLNIQLMNYQPRGGGGKDVSSQKPLEVGKFYNSPSQF